MDLMEATSKALNKDVDINKITVLRNYLKWFDNLDNVLEDDSGYSVISEKFSDALDEFVEKEIDEKIRVENELKKLEKDVI